MIPALTTSYRRLRESARACTHLVASAGRGERGSRNILPTGKNRGPAPGRADSQTSKVERLGWTIPRFPATARPREDLRARRAPPIADRWNVSAQYPRL